MNVFQPLAGSATGTGIRLDSKKTGVGMLITVSNKNAAGRSLLILRSTARSKPHRRVLDAIEFLVTGTNEVRSLLMIAGLGRHRAYHGQFIRHRRQLLKRFAELNAGVLVLMALVSPGLRAPRLWIGGVDVAHSATHRSRMTCLALLPEAAACAASSPLRQHVNAEQSGSRLSKQTATRQRLIQEFEILCSHERAPMSKTEK